MYSQALLLMGLIMPLTALVSPDLTLPLPGQVIPSTGPYQALIPSLVITLRLKGLAILQAAETRRLAQA